MSLSAMALILARGGSKSIPRKNILPLGGKPLIAYTIQHAIDSKYIDRIVVSTDDEDIARVAREWGAETPFLRPQEFAQDHSQDFDAFYHCLDWIRTHEDRLPDLVVQLRVTNPVRNVELIDQAIEAISARADADSLKSVSRPSESPYKMWANADAGCIRPLLTLPDVKEPHCQPRQMLPQIWWQNGYVDIIRPRVILDLKMMYGTRVLPFFIAGKMHELDYPEDIPTIEAAILASSRDAQEPQGEARHSV